MFEKRPIETSATSDDYYAVTKGIEPGERVVTHGNFLIDSQTRLTRKYYWNVRWIKGIRTATAAQRPGRFQLLHHSSF